MNSRYTGVPGEIAIVQCEYVGNSVNQHGSYERGIVHLRTRYRVPDDKATPLRMDAFTIRQQAQLGFDDSGPLIGFSDGQAKSILGERSSADVPKLDNILGCAAQLLAAANEGINRAADYCVIGIMRLRQAQKYVGIGGKAPAPQSWSW